MGTDAHALGIFVNSDGLVSGLCSITCSSYLGQKVKEMEEKTRRQRAATNEPTVLIPTAQSTSESVLSPHVQKSTGQVLSKTWKKYEKGRLRILPTQSLNLLPVRCAVRWTEGDIDSEAFVLGSTPACSGKDWI